MLHGGGDGQLLRQGTEARQGREKNARTGLQLGLLGLADDELVELLLIFGAEVLQALLGFGGDLKLVHGCGLCWCGDEVLFSLRMRGVRWLLLSLM